MVIKIIGLTIILTPILVVTVLMIMDGLGKFKITEAEEKKLEYKGTV